MLVILYIHILIYYFVTIGGLADIISDMPTEIFNGLKQARYKRNDKVDD